MSRQHSRSARRFRPGSEVFQLESILPTNNLLGPASQALGPAREAELSTEWFNLSVLGPDLWSGSNCAEIGHATSRLGWQLPKYRPWHYHADTDENGTGSLAERYEERDSWRDSDDQSRNAFADDVLDGWPSLLGGSLRSRVEWRAAVQGLRPRQDAVEHVLLASTFVSASAQGPVSIGQLLPGVQQAALRNGWSLAPEADVGPPPDNNPPIAEDDFAETAEDTPIEIDVKANDYDPDTDPIFIDSWDVLPAHGTVTQTQDSKLRYTPDHDFYGQDSFNYTVIDPWGVADNAQVTVTVTLVNDETAAFNDAYKFGVMYPLTIPEHVSFPVGLLHNDIDFDRIPDLTVNSWDSTGLQGTVAVYQDGSFDFMPANGFYGLTSFSYNETDGIDVSESATVYLFVVPLEHEPCPTGDPDCGSPPPQAMNDYYALGENEVSVAAEDAVIVNDTGAFIAILDGHPPSGRLTHFDDDGSFNYTPELVPTGQLFGYTIFDMMGRSAPAAVSLYELKMEIYNGQGAANPVADKDRNSVGAFTVTNLNDTDVDGNPDVGDNEVVRNPNNPASQDEVDLMKVVVFRPNDPNDARPVVTIAATYGVEFWAASTKGIHYTWQMDEKIRLYFEPGEASKTIWAELANKSLSLRDMKIAMQYKGEEYSVRATGVWAVQMAAAHDFEPVDSLLSGQQFGDMEDPPKKGLSYFGYVGLVPPSNEFGIRNVMVIQFLVTPNGIGKQPGVRFDVTRQRQYKAWGWMGPYGWQPYDVWAVWPAGDIPNDDSHNWDESRFPTQKNHFYVFDAPGIPSPAHLANQPFSHYVARMNFREFMRVRFDSVRPGTNAMTGGFEDKLDGSRTSEKWEWHMRSYVARQGGYWHRIPCDQEETDQNDVAPGLIDLDAPMP